ncbi:adenylate/guanylate cyclase domain-containing protein [Mesorhizobium sp. WSM3879]|uniref:adenylate/guanylate cyclase domain-containing protein n=1 Tax=Mesorhizobium sp. WSM3879 TaxID=2029406 RepID=UPI0015CCCEC0|nr:adenylate/guanylate cyclase domain-containing protein [Mesorhizobium sp. WSM3879]
MDIAAWLRGIGLEQYEQVFRDNAIDPEILPELTDADLEKLGVLLGHRKRLLKAIVESQPTTNRSNPNITERTVQPRAAGSIAERRQLTVVFVDLVGSTALSSRLDPEDLREIIGAYHHCAADTVTRFGGFVAKYMGDGVLVYFGYPQAHENDAEQAVRAGLALIDAVGRLQQSDPLRVRIGIATGQVVVGDLITSGEGQERGVVGETPNLAARLQTIAQPNAVVIAPQTRQLLGDLFEYRDLGPVRVKGFPEPTHPYQVVREGTIESRFDALHGATPTPLVGREDEIELLQRQWHCAKSGKGRVVLMSGEPGIGKSRLIVTLQEGIQNESHSQLRYFCSPHHQDSALHPTIVQLERAAGLERDDTPERKLDKLAALLAPISQGDGALVAELLSLPTEGRFPSLQLTPQRKKEKTFEALLGHLERLTRKGPILMLYEDVHWIDPSSRELLDLLIEHISRLPVLLVVSFRPEFQPPWTGQPHVTLLALSRFDRRDGVALVQRVVGSGDLPSDVVAEIIERADGVPLFVEELTKAVLEGGNASNLLSRTASTALNVPATLHASLLARLDRLGSDAREIAQVGAVIGREFSFELLSAVTQRNQAELNGAMDQLVTAGLAFCRGLPSSPTYVFKHALIQDAAYGTLLRGRRQELHRRVVAALEEQWPEIAETQPELLAKHCAQAHSVEQGIAYYIQAGQRALVRSNMAEAAAQLRKGFALLSDLPDSASRDRQELELQILSGRMLIATKGYDAPVVAETYARARSLCEQLGNPPQVVSVMYGQFVHRLFKGPLPAAQKVAADLLHLGESSRSAAVTSLAHGLCGAACFQLGDFVSACAHLKSGLAQFDHSDRLFYSSLSLQDRKVTQLSYLSLGQLCLGYLDQARVTGDAAVEEACSLSHPFSLAQALTMIWDVDRATRSSGEVQARTDTIISVSEEHGFTYFRTWGNVFRGLAMVEGGRIEQGIALLRAGEAESRATGAVQFFPYLLTLLAYGEGKANKRERALSHLIEAERLMAESEDRFFESELHRVRGELLQGGKGSALAEDCFRQAIGVAQRQNAKFWELRAAISLARLWGEQGKRAAAGDLLGPIYGWFTEGFDTPVLQEAKELLAEL